jgi:hypothetical protein
VEALEAHGRGWQLGGIDSAAAHGDEVLRRRPRNHRLVCGGAASPRWERNRGGGEGKNENEDERGSGASWRPEKILTSIHQLPGPV